MAGIDDNINELFSFAEGALTDARSQASRISSSTVDVNEANLEYTADLPSISTPAELSDYLTDTNRQSVLSFIEGQTNTLIDQYFPEIGSCLKYTPEQWLCGILTGQKPLGLSAEVFEAVWHQSRDREYRARNSAVAQLRVECSMRGFSLPTGALVQATMEAEERASDAVADVNRAQTGRDAEIKLDLLKFAEEQALQIKRNILQSVTDLYRTLSALPSNELEASRMKVSVYESFNRALSDIHRVQLGFEELRLQAANLRMNGKLDEDRIRVAASDGSRNGALGQAVQAFARVAEGAASAAGTLNASIVSGS